MARKRSHSQFGERQAKARAKRKPTISPRADISVDEARFLDIKILEPAVRPKSKAEVDAIRKAVRQVLKEKPLFA